MKTKLTLLLMYLFNSINLVKLKASIEAENFLKFSVLLLAFLILPSSVYSNCNVCTNNLVSNGTFNSNVNNWLSYNGTFTRSTAYPQCGSSGHAELRHSTGWAGFYQDITSLTPGGSYRLSFWGGVHNNSANSLFGVEFYNGSTYLNEATLQIDKVLGGTPSMQYYTFIFTVPNNANKVRVIGKINDDYIKVDEVCLTIDNSIIITNDCDSGVNITTHAGGTNQNCSNNPDITINIPSSSQVTNMVAEVVYKNQDPGAFVNVTTTSPSGTHTLFRVFVAGTSSNVYVYRGVIPNTAGAVRVNSVSNSCSTNTGLQSLVVYAFRSIQTNLSQYGKFTSLSGYCDLKTFSIAIPTSSSSRDLAITIPISELTTDNRYLRVKGTAGSATNSTIIYGPDASLNSCCVNVVTLNLINVPGSANSVNFEIDTRSTANPGSPAASGCGQSWVLASLVNVNIDCGVTNPCVNFASLAQSETNLVKTRTVTDEVSCVSQPNRVFWSDCLLDNSPEGTSGNLKFWKIVSGGTFKEYCDGTAYLEMTVQNVVNSNYRFNISIIYSGRTFTAPSGSPHFEGCTSSASSNWYYYTNMKGSLIGTNGLAGGNISFDRKGGAFQIGTNASLFGTSGSFGASGWMMYSIISHPTAFNFKGSCGMDLNFFLSGGNLTSAQASVCNTVCPGGQVNLNGYAVGGKPGYTYNWSNGLGAGQNKTVTPTTTTTYRVTATDTNSCTSTDEVTINVSPAPNVNAGVDATICTGQSIIITANATGGTSPYTYAWNNGLGSGASKTVNPGSNTTYIVTVTDSKGCTATDDIVITVGSNINLTANGATICLGAVAQISASASQGSSPYIYYWSDGLGTGATKNVSPSATKTYTVTVEDNNGCTKTATATVTVRPLPSVQTSSNQVCAGSTLNISSTPSGGTPGYTYSWTGPNSFTASTQNVSRPNATIAMSGLYNVTVTDTNGCTATSARQATVIPAPTVDVGPDINLCTGDEQVINSTVSGIPSCGTSGITNCVTNITNSNGYIQDLNKAAICGDNAGAKLWTQGGDGTSYITLDMGSNLPVGTQICVRVKLEHCSNTNSSVSDMRIRTSTLANSEFSDLVASKTFSHTSYQTYCYSLTSSHRYVRVQDNGKCSIRLDYLQYTTPDTYNNTVTYLWTGSGIIGSNTGTSITVNQNGTYTLVVTDCNGCTASDQVNVNIHNNVQAHVDDAEVCEGKSVILTANTLADATYEWTEAGSTTIISTSQSITVSPSTTRVYIVTVRVNGCEDSDDALVTVNPKPLVNLNTAEVCIAETLEIFSFPSGGSPGYTYLWSGPNGFSATSENISRPNATPSMSGNYSITVTDSKGCTATANINAIVNPLPTLSASITEVTVFNGNNGAIDLTVSGGASPYSYIWNNGATTQDLSGLSAGLYTVTVTDNKGCIVSTLYELSVGHPGDCTGLRTQTMGGWGAPAAGNNPGVYRNANFASAFPNGLEIGCTNKLRLTTAQAVQNFLPCGGTGALLSAGTQTNPNCIGNVFAGQLVALTLSVTFDLYDPNFAPSNFNLKDLKIGSGPLQGLSVQQLLIEANNLIGGCGSAYSISQLSTALTLSNESFVDGKVTNNYLVCCEVSVSATGGEICVGSTIQINANASNGTAPYTYAWSNGLGSGPSKSVSPSINTTYSVTVTDANGCSKSTTVNVIVNPTPVVDAGPDTEICIGHQINLTAIASGGTPPYTYGWNNPSSSGAVKTVNPITNTTYIVTVTDSKGCTSTDNVTVIVNNPPVVSAINDGPLTCLKTSVILTANPATGVSYLWFNGATTRTTSVNNSGTYSVTVTDLITQCTAVESTTVNEDKVIPTVNAGPDVTINCTNPSATLTATGSGSFMWSTGQSTASINVNPDITTIYTVTVTGSNGCTATDQVTVTANKAKPTASLTANGNNCITSNAQLFGGASGGTAPYSFSYGGPNGFSSQIQNPLITDNGTYTLTVTDVNGCTDTESIVIFSEFTPIVIVITSEICVGETVTLTASGGVSYQWSSNVNNATTASVMVIPIVTTSYTVTVTSPEGCVGTGTATITVYQNPVINNLDVVQNSSCNNTGNTGRITVTATGEPGLTLQYRINGGVWQLSNVFNNLGNGVYNVEVSYTTRLCFSDPAQATINSNPGLVVVAEDDKIICPSTPFSLIANANGGTAPYSFTWSNGQNGSTINIPGILVNTSYTVTVTDSKGCTATDIVNVSVIPPAISSIVGPDQVCVDEFAVFSVNPPIPNATYFWDFNGGISADGDNDDVSETVKWPAIFQNSFRTVSLTITKDNCPVTYTKQVFVKQGPFINTPGSYDVCQGGAVQIGPNPNDPNQVSPGATFLWTPNLFINNNTVAQPVSNPPFDITYTLTATINGCVETRQVHVNVDVNLNPIADAGPDKTICLGEPVVIGGNPTATPPPGGAIQGVVWIPAAGLNNPLLENPTANPAVNTQYQVIVVATSGCADTAYMNLTVQPKPSVIATANPTEICNGESTLILAAASGGTPGYTYTWSDGLGNGASKTVAPNTNRTYSVTVTDVNGCTASTSVTVIVNQRPTVTASAVPNSVCDGFSSQLTAVGAEGELPYTYVWSDNLGSGPDKTVSPVATKTYFVTVTDNNGCTGSTSVTVTVYPKPEVTLTATPPSICVGESTLLTATGSNGLAPYTYSWSNGLGQGGNTRTVNPLITTTYTVTLTDSNQCTALANVTVIVHTRPNLNITATPDVICKGSTSQLTASASGGASPYTYSWSNGLGTGNTKTVSPSSTATYFVTVSDLNGCTASSSVTVVVEEKAKVGDFVWEDKNANGLQDFGELGLNLVPVRLYDAGNDVLVTQTTTNAQGFYEFEVCKGTYYIEFGDFPNHLRTLANIGANDNIDSDANQLTGRTDNFILNPGDNNQTVDAGYYKVIDLRLIKRFVSAVMQPNGTYNLTYTIDVSNLGGPGQYDLKDTPGFDNDISIISASFTSNAPGNAFGNLLGSGPWIMADDQPIGALATHNYTLTINVSIDLTDNSGDNIYSACGSTTQTPVPGEGLYNKASVDTNNDGIPEAEDDDCGELPFVILVKDFVSVTPNPNGSYTVNYQVRVTNIGGATGQYWLKDTPLFDDDVVINSGSYSGHAVGVMQTSGSTTLATNVSIIAGATHTYNISFNVSMNLDPGSPGNGNKIYTPCAVAGNGPGSGPGQGLFNRAELDRNGDNITDQTDDACGDLPFVTMVKDFVSIVPNHNGTYTVNYQIRVRNIGGATGQYWLKDTPLFDDDVVINSGSFSGQANGVMNTTGSTTLATNVSINAGAIHTYNITFNTSLNLLPGSPGNGDKIYTPCAVQGNGPGSGPGQGYYNLAELDRNGDGTTDLADDACGDDPITMVKNFLSVTPLPDGTHYVRYEIVVKNLSGAMQQYTLLDYPLFDDDVTINAWDFTFVDLNNGVGSGPSFLGAPPVPINLGTRSITNLNTHIYTLGFNVTLDLEPGSTDGGNNVYTPCAVPGNGPGSNSGQGLYNRAEIDITGDGITDITDDACGDIPYVTLVKNFVSTTANPNGSYNVTYQILVNNNGGTTGQYSLKDTPLFDNDITINSGSYSGQASGPMNTTGATTLATGTSIGAGATHTYNVTFNVTLNLAPGSTDGGDNIYTPCAVSGNGPGSGPGQGLYNLAELDRTGDGVTDIIDDACGDLPNVTMIKNFVSTTPNPNGSYNVTYQILVNNNGGATGQYSLKDTPLFDNDITINSGSYSGQASGPMNTSGATTLANGVSINAGATHTYNVTFNVTLNLAPGSPDGGDNIYTPCAVSGNGPGSGPGQGLYNLAELDRTGDGVTDISDDACGDLPNVTMIKNFVSATPNPNGSYNVTYQILVNNNGGATGQYSLKDTPLFDNDITINSGSYSGQASGPMNTSGATTLANGVSINAGATHTYNVTFNVTLNLAPGSPDGGDNIYTPCAVSGNGPGSGPGQGLYNLAELDRTGDGVTDITDDACGDLPNVTMIKNFVSATPNPNGSFNVTYQILVNNNGGATGQYSLKDTPLFDNDITINSGSYSGQASGPMNTTGATTLATGTSIGSGATHTYNVTFNVTLNLAPGSPDGGDNIYTPCAVSGNGPGSGPGQGLYNLAELDRTGDGVTDISDDACGDLPNVTMIKNFVSATPNPNGSYNVTYQILVNNNGGATGQYSLKDTPLFDNDITINSGNYSGQANGAMNTSGATTLANGVSINAGATHTYNVTFNVTLNLAPGSPDGGDNIYTPCAVSGNGPGSGPGQGLYNLAELDRTGDGVTDISDDACGDLPNVTMIKNFVSATPNPNGSYNVTYQILVNNNGGATGQYSLKDTPLFDNDITINSGNYSGQASGPMNTTGATTLATGTSIGAGATHTYNVTFNVTLNLAPGSPDGGDNIYTPCAVSGNGPGSGPGQGLYNLAELDRTGDGVTDISDDACGDLPNVMMIKNFVSATPNPNGSYNVTYQILVNNNGGATGQYSLKDTPLFDNDITINSGSYSGQASGPMNTTGATTLATGTSIGAGATHTYNVTFNVTLNLAPGSPDGGDNIYTPCAVSGNGPGSGPGQGLYNLAELDRTGDGVTDISDDACGDLPNVTMIKNFVSATPNPNGSYNVTYQILVNNNGGATGQYSLKDTPLFDNDITINSGNYSGQANGAMNTSGATTLANGASINAGATHIYNVTFNVTLNLAPGSPDGGDNIYTPCAVSGNGPGSGPGQGLYNLAELDRTGDGVTDISDDACGDLPNVTMIKNFVSVNPGLNGTYNVTYQILVGNTGGTIGQYSLKDTPLFDNDVTINSGSYSGQANGVMNTTGATTLANAVSIAVGATHTYNVTFNVTLDVQPGSDDGGDNIYTPCAVAGNGPGSGPGQGLYNLAELDRTGDGVTDISDDACGDLPGSIGDFVWHDINGNGKQDIGEPGIPNVTVRLFSGGGVELQNQLTNQDGKYLFTNLNPGQYYVRFDRPVGYQTTVKDVPGDDSIDSDADPVTGNTQIYILGPGESNLTVDAGYYKYASIGDFVWEDSNANGVQDLNETGIPNVLVRLLNENGVIVRSTTTNGTGFYLFDNLTPGTYSVRFTTPGGYISTTKDVGADDTKDSDADNFTGTTGQYVLLSDETNLTVDAGYYRLARIGDFVWEDRNANGIQDNLEPGIPNVTVNLTGVDGNGTPVNRTTTTSGTGLYEFNGLVPGNYTVTFVRPGSDYLSSPPNVGLNDNVDSDADPVTGNSPVVALASGDNNTTIDAGYYRCAKVGDYVWLDLGTMPDVQDALDLGLNNIRVELYQVSNPSIPFDTQLTRNNPSNGQPGYYLFECVPPGEYFIKVPVPSGTNYKFVTPNQGGNDMLDSDIIDFTNERTSNFTVNYAQIILDIDIGFKVVLPVELTIFEGKWNKLKDVNELLWVTASELNSDYFEVQRSFKGSNFEKVGIVDAAGNSTNAIVYGFDDENIAVNGVYSYRLRQVDFDGKETYSSVVEILVDRRGEIKTSVYPNPAIDFVNISLNAYSGAKVVVDLYDNVGRLVRNNFVNTVLENAELETSIDFIGLNPGVYMVNITVDGQSSNHKLIILK
ncbi:MAG: carboxypeptidase regulatory-like domain-containing protein [Saprospiraceae bacterium]|nr:carboxypeptidase regulatory-like domain-containing protein [Saprospiraceae bacterium]